MSEVGTVGPMEVLPEILEGVSVALSPIGKGFKWLWGYSGGKLNEQHQAVSIPVWVILLGGTAYLLFPVGKDFVLKAQAHWTRFKKDEWPKIKRDHYKPLMFGGVVTLIGLSSHAAGGGHFDHAIGDFTTTWGVAPWHVWYPKTLVSLKYAK